MGPSSSNRFRILVPLLFLSVFSSSVNLIERELTAGAVLYLLPVSAGPVGVCYGRNANNLPTPIQAVALCKSKGITMVRLFDADPGVIQSFADTGISLSITISNSDITGIALDQNVADKWIGDNVLPYVPATSISSIAVGTEVLFTNVANLSAYIVPAMRNIFMSLKTNNLDTSVQVVSPNSMSVLSNSYPPSAGVFDPTITASIIIPMLSFLSQTGAPFMLNSYPYYAYVNDPTGVPLEYALFTSKAGVIDSNTQLHYTNLFDAQVDAVYAAMAAVNFTNIPVVVSETGWPSKGDSNERAANKQNAQTYNQNLINELVRDHAGTPMKPGLQVQAYIFALYNENLKPDPESERNFGIYFPDGSEVYPLNFYGGTGTVEVQNRTWCVARNDASNSSLQIALDYACGPGYANCNAIQEGGPCYEPNTYVNHASYAFNDFFQKSNMDPRACNFSGTANLTQRDPSYGSCIFYARNPSSGCLSSPQVFYYGFSALVTLLLLPVWRI
ncbi:hypothetical protein R1sor_005621 [Riccia sorocarpa]|uniref:glucan endo-1,3-beta-D-glucosidase n=1 Tax=Riccia sorocarpa TaxID=122646 RepID=A0ABD3HPG9_9MARC